MGEDTAFLSELRWARIRVKSDGSVFPKVTEVTVGDHSYEIQLWWEIQPRIIDARLERPSEKAGSPMGEDEVFPRIGERVRSLKDCCPQGVSLSARINQGMVEKTTRPIVQRDSIHVLERVGDLEMEQVMDLGHGLESGPKSGGVGSLLGSLLKTLLEFAVGGLYWQPKKMGTLGRGPLDWALTRSGLGPILSGQRKVDPTPRSLCFIKKSKLGTQGMIDSALSRHSGIS